MGSAGTFGSWQVSLVAAVLLLGLLGTVLPGVPGPLAVWAAVFWWATATRTTTAWLLLSVATGLLLLSAALRLLLPTGSSARPPVRRRSLLCAGVVGIVGFFVVPVLGGAPGFVLGMYGWERVRLGSRGAAVASTRRQLRAYGWAVLVQLMACLLVTGGWLVTLVYAP